MGDSQDRESSRLADPVVPRCRGGGPGPWNEFVSIRIQLVLACFSKLCYAISHVYAVLATWWIHGGSWGIHRTVNPLALQTQPCPGAAVGAWSRGINLVRYANTSFSHTFQNHAVRLQMRCARSMRIHGGLTKL